MPCLALVLDCFLSAWTHVKDFKQEYEPVLFVLFRHSFVNVCKQMWKQEFLATAVLRTPRFAQFSFPHLHIFTRSDYFSFLWQTLSIPEQMDHTCNFLDFYSGFCRRQIVLPMSLILKLEMQNLISTQKHSEGHWKMRELIVILSHFLCRTYQTRCSTCIAGSTAPTPSPEPSGHYTYLSFLRPQGRRGKHIDKWPPHFSNTRPILTKIIPNVTPWILSAPHFLPKKICPIIPLAFFILQLHLE